MPRNVLPLILAIAAIAVNPAAEADDDQPPLLVSTNGTDAGSCQDRASPCRSIAYALKRVGKNGRIRVTEGSYELGAVEDIVYLLSGAIDVRGGFRQVGGTLTRTGAESTLIGVPVEYADELAQRGFRVIADSKSLGPASAARARALVETQAGLETDTAATPCTGGSAAAFPCEKVDLLAHVADRTGSARGADIWGFMDLNTHREYAIVGYSIGTAIYDVSDPEHPREVGFVDGQATTWRDIKVHQFWNAAQGRWNAFAYVTADNASDGLFIIDLSQLPQRISRIAYASDFAAAHNVYLTGTEFSTGLSLSDAAPKLILAGPSTGDGRFRAYDLSDPASPTFIAEPGTPGGQPGNDRLYMHDAASMTVTDTRKSTQCVNAAHAAHCTVLFDFNESTVDIWDLTLPESPVRLSRTTYDNADYVHSGWWSEDRQYLFVQDETDERDRGLRTTLRVFSLADLTSPSLAGTWSGPTPAIDHNGFVRGNRYYMSNYSRGLTILDITNPANPVSVGRFDTYPASDTVGFPGAWGTYPFLPSGNVLISDIDSGLYVVADKTLDVAAGTLSFTAPSFGTEEARSASIVVQRAGGAAGAVTVQWEIIAATASIDDVSVQTGTLSWGPGDATERTISVPAPDDGVSEGLEHLLVRLAAPSGGATLSSPSIASLYVSDAGESPFVEFMDNVLAVAERGFGTAVAVVTRGGSANGAVSVDFAVGEGNAIRGQDYAGPASGTVHWASGDADPKWIEFEIVDDGSGETEETFDLTLTNATGAAVGARARLQIHILDGTGLNQAPNAVAGPGQTTAPGSRVALNGSQSNDSDGDSLTYAWSQTMGPTVTLDHPDTSRATFTAPPVNSDTLLRFQLTVTDPGGLSDSAVTSVTVSRSAVPNEETRGGGGMMSMLVICLLGFAAAVRAATRMDAI